VITDNNSKIQNITPKVFYSMLELYKGIGVVINLKRRTYAHEPGATAITGWLGIAFSTDGLVTDDMGQDVREHAQK